MNFSILHDSIVNDICIAIIVKKLNFLAKLMENMKRMELEKMFLQKMLMGEGC